MIYKSYIIQGKYILQRYILGFKILGSDTALTDTDIVQKLSIKTFITLILKSRKKCDCYGRFTRYHGRKNTVR